jgi:RNA recognition motif-containing protein
VNFSDKPKPKEPLYPETEYKLFVGNLSWNVTSEILTQAFQEHGTVVGARVLYDGETGRSRGYGFVSYANKSEMEAALTVMDNVVCYFSSIHSFMRSLFFKRYAIAIQTDIISFVFVTTM